MSTICSLRAGRRRVSMPRGLYRAAVFALCVSLCLLLIFNVQLYPGISTLAESAAINRAEEIIATAFSAALVAGGEAYDGLVTVGYRADGIVASLSCHMQKLNAARNGLLLAVLDALRTGEGITVGLPLGNLFGGEAFSGRGPVVHIRVLLAQGAHAYMESEFRSAGINQTLHRVLFTVSITLTVMMPTRSITTAVKQSYCVAETVIVGEVPDAFTQISRLTDDVNEEDIDDINDFGAHV